MEWFKAQLEKLASVTDEQMVLSTAQFLAHESHEHQGYGWDSLEHHTQDIYLKQASRLLSQISAVHNAKLKEAVEEAVNKYLDYLQEVIELSEKIKEPAIRVKMTAILQGLKQEANK